MTTEKKTRATRSKAKPAEQEMPLEQTSLPAEQATKEPGELAEIAEAKALAVFTEPNALDKLVAGIEKQMDGLVFDMSTSKGRDECRATAARVSRSKTYIEKVATELKRAQDAIKKTISTNCEAASGRLVTLAAQVRQPLTDWEAEEERKRLEAQEKAEKIASVFMALRNALITDGLSIEDLEARIGGLEAMTFDAELLGERHNEAVDLRDSTLETLHQRLAERQKAASDAAEMERLKAELEQLRAEKEARDNPASTVTTTAPEALREDDAQGESQDDGQAYEEMAGHYVAGAQEEPSASPSETPAESERERKARINREALAGMTASYPNLAPVAEDVARAVITLIANGRVPHISITY